MELHAIGIDLGKTVFHLVGRDSSGKVVWHGVPSDPSAIRGVLEKMVSR